MPDLLRIQVDPYLSTFHIAPLQLNIEKDDVDQVPCDEGCLTIRRSYMEPTFQLQRMAAATLFVVSVCTSSMDLKAQLINGSVSFRISSAAPRS